MLENRPEDAPVKLWRLWRLQRLLSAHFKGKRQDSHKKSWNTLNTSIPNFIHIQFKFFFSFRDWIWCDKWNKLSLMQIPINPPVKHGLPLELHLSQSHLFIIHSTYENCREGLNWLDSPTPHFDVQQKCVREAVHNGKVTKLWTLSVHIFAWNDLESDKFLIWSPHCNFPIVQWGSKAVCSSCKKSFFSVLSNDFLFSAHRFKTQLKVVSFFWHKCIYSI